MKDEKATNEALLIESALRVWRLNETRLSRVYPPLSEADLQREVFPGRNRLIYVWGHVTAVNDAMLPLLKIGPALFPELEQMFLSNPDRAVAPIFSGELIKEASARIQQALWSSFVQWTPSEWLEPHAASSHGHLSADPTRNRFNVVVNRTAHMAYHLGQAVLAAASR
jgi:hypothetical protein